jgi:NAD(P)-dependent dehydrogenase (short-subunit alcohol dehydrogenase family)
MSNDRKVAIITGASQGIGAGLVKAFRDRDYRVVATSRSIKQGTDGDIVAVPGDVGDPATAEAVVREAVARFGRIDTLVNNAGIFNSKPFTDYTEEDFNRKIATNLAGFFHITQHVAAEMLKQGSGHIVSITTSLTDQPTHAVPSVRRHASRLRGHARQPPQGPLVGDHPEVRRHDLLHGPDCDPDVHEVGLGHPGEVRPVLHPGPGVGG